MKQVGADIAGSDHGQSDRQHAARLWPARLDIAELHYDHADCQAGKSGPCMLNRGFAGRETGLVDELVPVLDKPAQGLLNHAYGNEIAEQERKMGKDAGIAHR